MTLEALSSNELLNFIVHETISATPFNGLESSDTTIVHVPIAASTHLSEIKHSLDPVVGGGGCNTTTSNMNMHCLGGLKLNARKASQGAQGRKKRRKRPKVCKNKEEAEAQRMTHIAIERNRRKQMNAHLAVLRSLMPESYVQRGDQATIVGGAIEFVKELERLLQSLEAEKLQHQLIMEEEAPAKDTLFMTPPFSQFFAHPQYTWSRLPNNTSSRKYSATSSSSQSSRTSCHEMGNEGRSVAGIADIEVTLVEVHANIRILSKRSPGQLLNLVGGFRTLNLSILHLSVTALHPLVLYSISSKVEEGCQFTTADDIAGAVHHMLRIIEEGGVALC
ncbi:hypothetical protein SAY87_020495 [Trapa incisa]|uniref:BHLH domain-containing protein n=1 Tax=Trapa incisa TaxID=236973 RepID=A0AAN7PMH7_9MYRT|nr:hypothetical protein SAY87_020495 [Trapa incisa]